MNRLLKATLCLALSAGVQSVNAAHPARGLWVGEVALNQVNEATGAVGDSNTYEFTDPQLTTPTSDTAHLRLILHVNGAGQVQLLKSVAIAPVGTLSDGSIDVVLITDPELYSEYSGLAKRVASAFYDFGDESAVSAVQKLIDVATETAVNAGKNGATAAVIKAAVDTAIQDILDHVDVQLAYIDRGTGGSSFITNLTGGFFQNQADVEALGQAVAEQVIAVATDGGASLESMAYVDGSQAYTPLSPNPLSGIFSAAVTAARNLENASFYGDTRGFEAIERIIYGSARAVAVLDPSTSLADKITLAQQVAVAEWHNAADTDQAYNRFLAGSSFKQLSDPIIGAAVSSAISANSRGLLAADINTEVEGVLISDGASLAAYFDAETIFSESLWGDTRGRDAVDVILFAARTAAVAQVQVDATESVMIDAVRTSTNLVLNRINGGYVFSTAPSEDFTAFVTSDAFTDAAELASETASSEVAFQYAANVRDDNEFTFFANEATTKALAAVRNQVAAIPQVSVPLSGSLEAGQAVTGEFYLPALAPTNPFLHRLHPDHTTGIAITRRVMLSVDTLDPGDSDLSAYGVSLLKGTYEEELFGLHKPLGAQRDIGLKTKGSFTLNRISLVDSLNF